MRKPEDTKSLDTLPAPKRGRGRPRLENPLSQAERARRYRARKRALESRAAPVKPNAKTASNRTANNKAEDDALFWREMYEAEARRAADRRLSNYLSRHLKLLALIRLSESVLD